MTIITAQRSQMSLLLISLAYELVVSVDHTPWLETWIEKDRPYAKPFPGDFVEPELYPNWEPKM